jgi:TadE-like protein
LKSFWGKFLRLTTPALRATHPFQGGERGQAIVEAAFQIPLMIALLFGGVEIGRIFYTYHALQKALRGGAGLAARSVNVNYCDSADMTLLDIRNFVVYGNLQGEGNPIVPGLTTDMIQILPERLVSENTSVTECVCSEATDSCDVVSTGRAPDFVVLNFGPDGFPLRIPFPFANLGSVNLRVSVRMPVTGS